MAVVYTNNGRTFFSGKMSLWYLVHFQFQCTGVLHREDNSIFLEPLIPFRFKVQIGQLSCAETPILVFVKYVKGSTVLLQCFCSLKIFEHCKWQIYFKVNMHPQMYLQKLASKSRDLLDRSSLPWTSGLGTLTTVLYITQFFWAPDFAMEEKKFGLLLLPEVHRRPGEGDLEGERSAWRRVLI